MTNYTLHEAETQLRDLVTLTQKTHQPIAIHPEKDTQPVAFLLTSQIYETFRRQQHQLFRLQLKQLFSLLETTEEKWEQEAVRHEFIESFPAGIRFLWDACPENFRELCAMVRMASQRLSYESLNLNKIHTLRTSLEQFHAKIPQDVEVDRCHKQLIQSGLPPAFVGNTELVKSYMDEL